MRQIVPAIAAIFLVAFFIPAHVNAQSCSGFRTQTQGGWGTKAAGNNPGAYRDKNFAAAFPNGLTIGCTNKLVLTSSSAIMNFLPSGTTPSVLPAGTKVNPTRSTYSNVFAGQLVTAVLNVGFDLYDANFSTNAIHTGDLIIASGKFAGLTINQLIAQANSVIGGCSSGYTPSDLNDALNSFNNNYDGGTTNGGYTICPNPCGFVVNGNATQSGTQCFQLTTSDFHTVGSVFSTTPLDMTQNFQVNASMNFGVNDGGGDGIAFVLQGEGPHYIGNYGAGIGYHRFDGSNACMPVDNPGPVPSFIVEFDTYENHTIDCQDIGDVAADHIGFQSHSNAYHTSPYALAAPQAFPVNIEDGQNHDVLFYWDATAKSMIVIFTLSTNPLLTQTYTYSGDIVANQLAGNSSVYFGFTGSNGSFSPNVESVCISSGCTALYGMPAPPHTKASQNSLNYFSYQPPVTGKSFIVQPNPSNGPFKVRFPEINAGEGKLMIMTSDGRVVETRDIATVKGQSPDFDLSKYGKGIYFIHVNTKKGAQVQKVVIE